jgi:hypothetical protein
MDGLKAIALPVPHVAFLHGYRGYQTPAPSLGQGYSRSSPLLPTVLQIDSGARRHDGRHSCMSDVIHTHVLSWMLGSLPANAAPLPTDCTTACSCCAHLLLHLCHRAPGTPLAQHAVRPSSTRHHNTSHQITSHGSQLNAEGRMKGHLQLGLASPPPGAATLL